MSAPEGQSPPTTTLKTVLLILLLALLAILGNYLSLPVVYGVTFIFGSIFSLIAVGLFGTWVGCGVALVGSSYTWILWNHPYAIIIFVAEILFTGLALARGRRNILLVVSCYWLLLGMPLVALFYGGIMQMNASGVLIIMLKQGLNGICNALVASLMLSYLPLSHWAGRTHLAPPINYKSIFFHVFSVLLMVPLLGFLLISSYREVKSTNNELVTDLQLNAENVAKTIENWLASQQKITAAIVALSTLHPLEPSEELQQELAQLGKLSDDFHNLYLADEHGTTVAFYPPVNDDGASTIGLNFSDRDYFQHLKSTWEPVVSEVFTGRGGIVTPIFVIATPIIREGRFAGYGLGAVNLERMRHLLTDIPRRRSFRYTVVDNHDVVVVSTNEENRTLGKRPIPSEGTIRRVSAIVSLWIPGIDKNTSIMSGWHGASYLAQLPLGESGWKLLVEFPVAGLQTYLYGITTVNLSFVAVAFALSLVFASLLSQSFARGPNQLAVLSQDLPKKLINQEPVEWPVSRIEEMDHLSANFRQTADAFHQLIEEIQGINSTLEDRIEERTQELLTSEAQYSQLFSEMMSGLLVAEVVLDEDGSPQDYRLLHANPEAAKLAGIPLEQLIGRTGQELSFDLTDELLQSLFEVALTGKPFQYSRYNHKMGRYFDVRVFSPYRGQFALMFHDISDRKKSEQLLHQAKQDAEEMADAKTRFLSTVAHEFRTPLGLLVVSQGILENYGQHLSEKQVAEQRQQINSALDQLSRLVDSVLSFNRLENLEGRENASPLDVRQTCQSLAESVWVLLGLKHKFQVDLAEDCGQPLLNEELFRQLIENLLSNAFRYTPEGGKVALRVYRERDDLHIEVSDSGIGIQERDRERIFEAFYRGNNSQDRRGMGLGLSIVKGAVEKMGGTIWVKSKPGQGTSFFVRIPMTTAAEMEDTSHEIDSDH